VRPSSVSRTRYEASAEEASLTLASEAAQDSGGSSPRPRGDRMQGGEPRLPDGVKVGDVFADRYRLDRIIGWGGMGIVVAGHDLRLDISVAIKFLVVLDPENREAVRRFVGEARTAAQIDNEHVVRVFDVALYDDRVAYFVMERLHGQDLASALRDARFFPVQRAVDYVVEACEGVAKAHRKNIVHRDLKPANLFLADREDDRPILKVLDFGVAKRSAKGGPNDGGEPLFRTETAPRSMLGSPPYMSPEQMLSSGDVDHRADIWALGVTLYELVVGEPPYRGTTPVQIYSGMTAEGQHAWRARLQERAPELVPIVGRCLEPNLIHRYPSVAVFARELASLGSKAALDSAADMRLRSAVERTRDATIDVVTPRSDPPSRRSPAPHFASVVVEGPRRQWLVVAALTVLAATAIGGVLLLRRAPHSAHDGATLDTRQMSVLRTAAPTPAESAPSPEPTLTTIASSVSARPVAPPSSLQPRPNAAIRHTFRVPDAAAATSAADTGVGAAPNASKVLGTPVDLADAAISDLMPMLNDRVGDASK
jgi:serine/threonine protein kinase